MADTLRAAGVAAPLGATFTDVEAATAWVREHTRYPVIVKPLQSAGSDAVRLCQTEAELAAAARHVLATPSIFEAVNEAFLVQEFLRGREYVVNTVSCDGAHLVSDIWVYSKRLTLSGHCLYDRMLLLPSAGEPQDSLSAYAIRVLEAIGLRHGPAHAEIMLCERGPVLVEIGARLSGGSSPATEVPCLGHSQAELTFEAYLDKPRFLARDRGPYALRRHCLRVDVASELEGTIVAVPFAESARALPSFARMHLKRGVGDRLTKTVDLQSEVAVVYLTADSAAELERDYAQLLDLARSGFVVA